MRGFTGGEISPEAEKQTAVETAVVIPRSREEWGGFDKRLPCFWPSVSSEKENEVKPETEWHMIEFKI